MSIKMARNHWGWSVRGIQTWFRYGWRRYAVWGIERRPTRLCRKVGPIAWCRVTTTERMEAALAARRVNATT